MKFVSLPVMGQRGMNFFNVDLIVRIAPSTDAPESISYLELANAPVDYQHGFAPGLVGIQLSPEDCADEIARQSQPLAYWGHKLLRLFVSSQVIDRPRAERLQGENVNLK